MKRSTLGWVEILLGVLMVILGVYTMLNPAESIAAIVIAYAIIAIFSGIVDFIAYYRIQKRGGFGVAMLILSGILNVLVGILLLFNVGAGAWTLSILFPAWFIVHCIARLANLDFVKLFGSTFEYWFTLIANVIGIALGIMLLFNPVLSASTLVYFVAFYLLLEGFSSVILGFGNVGRPAN